MVVNGDLGSKIFLMSLHYSNMVMAKLNQLLRSETWVTNRGGHFIVVTVCVPKLKLNCQE